MTFVSSRWGLSIGVIALALGYSFSTGPFRAADEYAHFFRAYEVSEGRLIAARPGGGLLGDWLPASLAEVMKRAGGYPRDPVLRTSPEAMSAAWRVKLRPSRREFAHFPGAALHSPVMYLPAALAIATGRLLKANPLLLFYLARCANAIVAGGLIGWAIGRLRPSAPFFATIALLPMCLFQVGTLTADALSFAIIFVWYGEVLSAGAESGLARSQTKWFFLAAALSQLRFPYPLLGFLILAVPGSQLGEGRAARMRFLAIFFALLLVPCLVWVAIVQHLEVPMRAGVAVDPGAQLGFVLQHPLQFFSLVGAALFHWRYEWWSQTIGVFGWLERPVPNWILFGLTICLGLAFCQCDTRRLGLTKRWRAFYFLLSLAGFLCTWLIVYLAWNRVGAPQIEGWQGRYAIPLLPLAGLALANGWLRERAWIRLGTQAFVVLANLAATSYLAYATYF